MSLLPLTIQCLGHHSVAHGLAIRPLPVAPPAPRGEVHLDLVGGGVVLPGGTPVGLSFPCCRFCSSSGGGGGGGSGLLLLLLFLELLLLQLPRSGDGRGAREGWRLLLHLGGPGACPR